MGVGLGRHRPTLDQPTVVNVHATRIQDSNLTMRGLPSANGNDKSSSPHIKLAFPCALEAGTSWALQALRDYETRLHHRERHCRDRTGAEARHTSAARPGVRASRNLAMAPDSGLTAAEG